MVRRAPLCVAGGIFGIKYKMCCLTNPRIVDASLVVDTFSTYTVHFLTPTLPHHHPTHPHTERPPTSPPPIIEPPSRRARLPAS